MEGPHIHYYADMVRPLIGFRVINLGGERRHVVAEIKHRTLTQSLPLGKLLFLRFESDQPDQDDVFLRIHCLMFGDVRLNHTRPGKRLTLRMTFDTPATNEALGERAKVYVYLGSTRIEPPGTDADTIADRDICLPGRPKLGTFEELRKRQPETMVCDALMDQTWFPGLGNKIKNEVLFHSRIHPSVPLSRLSDDQMESLCKETEKFSQYFKQQVAEHGDRVAIQFDCFRKSKCANCGEKLQHEKLGALERKTHYCPNCQRL